MIAQVIQTDPVLTLIRKQLRALSNKIKVNNEDILHTLQQQIIKREVTEVEEAVKAKRRLDSAYRVQKRSQAKKQNIEVEPKNKIN
jgi:allophanate hydrolase subunit 1